MFRGLARPVRRTAQKALCRAESGAAYDWQDPLRLVDQLTEEESMVLESARSYAASGLMTRVIEANRNEHFHREIMTEMGELGLLGAMLPAKYGGSDLGYVSYGLIANAVENVDSGYRSAMSVQSSLVMLPIFKFGSEEQKEKYVHVAPSCCHCAITAMFVITVPSLSSLSSLPC